MCGIAGYVCTTKYEPKLDVAFPLMGVFMESRGNQSWGYTDGKNIHKTVGELQEGWTPDMTGAMQAALHTRHATKGAIISENSHPWDFGDGFIAMHNGVIDNYYDVNKQYGYDYPVDSQTLLRHIKEGRDLSEIEGYGAVVFWREGRVWLGTFNGGDLAIAKTEFGVVFASRDWAIDNALRMAGLPQAMHYQVDDGKLYYIKEGELFVTDQKLNVAARIVKTTWQDYKPSDLESLERRYGVTSRSHTPTNLKIKYDAVTCTWCGSGSRDLFDTPEGALCGQCARFAVSDAEDLLPFNQVTAADIAAETARNLTGVVTPVEACCELASFDLACNCDNQAARERRAADAAMDRSRFDSVEYFTRMTCREYAQNREIADLPIDDPCMTSCDECEVTLTDDEIIYVDESSRVEYVLCDMCYEDQLDNQPELYPEPSSFQQ